MKDKIRLIQWCVNITIVVIVVVLLNKYVYDIVNLIEISYKANDSAAMNDVIRVLPKQMKLLFAYGLITTVLIYLIHMGIGKFVDKKLK